MPFVPVPNTVMVEAIYEWDGQRVENTFYFERLSEPTLEEVTLFLEGINTIIQTELLPLLSNAIQLVELVATLLTTAESFSVSKTISPPVTGGVVGESVPSNVSYVITFKTALRGRANRGRNYVPGLPNAAVDTNTIVAGTRTGLLDFYTTLRAGASEGGWSMVVVSRYSGVDAQGKPIPRLVGQTTPISSFVTFDSTVDSQRRRLPGRGT
jgi:hypothetical protein